MLVLRIDQSLFFEELFETQVFLSQHHGLLPRLLLDNLLVLFNALGLERSLSIEKFVSSPDILFSALFVVIEKDTSLVVFVVDLPEVAVLATTHFLLLDGASHVSKFALVANQVGILPQIVVGVVGV